MSDASSRSENIVRLLNGNCGRVGTILGILDGVTAKCSKALSKRCPK